MPRHGFRRWLTLGAALAFVSPAMLLVGCGDDDVTEPPPPTPPGAVTVTASTDANTVTLSWTADTGATGYRAEIAASDPLIKTVDAATTEAVFTEADGVLDGVTYTATVYSINVDGETASANNPTVDTNFFP
jgi:hypothetical protein